MGLGKELAEGALAVAKDEEVQKATGGLMGKLFPYFGIRKRAVDTYISEIEKTDLSPDAKFEAILALKDKEKKLKNQRAVVEKMTGYAKDGTDFSDKSGVKEDFLDRFMESASYVSDEKMQEIWAQILAGEFESPGSTPSSMVRVLNEITPEYARAFRIICSMKVLSVGLDEENQIIYASENVFFPYMNNDELRNLGLTVNVINELEAIGLLKSEPLGGYLSVGVTGKVLLYINGKTIAVENYPDRKRGFPSGDALLTAAGDCLSRITPEQDIDGYLEMVRKYLEGKGVKFDNECKYTVTVTDQSEDDKLIQVKVED